MKYFIQAILAARAQPRMEMVSLCKGKVKVCNIGFHNIGQCFNSSALILQAPH